MKPNRLSTMIPQPGLLAPSPTEGRGERSSLHSPFALGGLLAPLALHSPFALGGRDPSPPAPLPQRGEGGKPPHRLGSQPPHHPGSQPLHRPAFLSAPAAFSQRGVALIVALIALVALSLAGIALVRSMGTGLTIAGNLAFKSTSTSAADVAIDAAAAWLASQSLTPSELDINRPDDAYYADWGDCDTTGNKTTSVGDNVQWETGANANANCPAKAKAVPAAAGLPAGYTASYIITRLCSCAGNPNAKSTTCLPSGVPISCIGRPAQSASTATDPQHGGDYAHGALTDIAKKELFGEGVNAQPYYRVIARVVGPRNTRSFVQTDITLE